MNITRLLALHEETCNRCFEIMEQKNNDYTGGAKAPDALANFKSSEAFGVPPAIGLMLRMQDKMKRVESFVADGELRVKGESVIDAAEDLVNYSILLKALLIDAGATDGETQPEP